MNFDPEQSATRSHIHFPVSMKTIFTSIIILCMTHLTHANLDWGGGSTQFKDQSGNHLSSATGYAVLVSISQGTIIDFRNFIPDTPADLITPGSILNDGLNINYVLAKSQTFYSGYLLNTAVPDLLIEDQLNMGASPGEQLYLVVWDAGTFVDNLPTDSSYFTVQPLYLDGEEQASATTNNEIALTPFSDVIHPENSLLGDQLAQLATYAGYNQTRNFNEWIAMLYNSTDINAEELKIADHDGDGRNNFEQYVFTTRPEINGAATSSNTNEAPQDGASEHFAEVTIQLRANDSALHYYVETSSDLRVWQRDSLDLNDNQWHSSNNAVKVMRSSYEGNGIWSLQLASTLADQCSFFKFSVDVNTI